MHRALSPQWIDLMGLSSGEGHVELKWWAACVAAGQGHRPAAGKCVLQEFAAAVAGRLLDAVCYILALRFNTDVQGMLGLNYACSHSSNRSSRYEAGRIVKVLCGFAGRTCFELSQKLHACYCPANVLMSAAHQL
jgi:hypothetical protein